jgi:A repeated domain in UCH-protein
VRKITVPDVGLTAKGWHTAGSAGHDPAAHEYEVLGCTPTDPSDIVKIAYDAQVTTDPANGPFYLDALKRVADVREDGMLSHTVRSENAIGHWGRSDVEKAFTEIGIMELDDVSAAHEDTIIEAFRVRFDEAADPAKRKAVLDAMQIIATARSSEYLLAMLKSVEETANNAAKPMTVERATKLLEIPDTTVDDDFLASIYISRVKRNSQASFCETR